MNKLVLISTFCFFLLQNTYAQKHQISDKDTLLYYLDNWGNLTSSKASADHFLVIMPADSSSGIKVYPVIEYYPNWKPKLMGYSRSQRYNNLIFEGESVEFYKTGYKKSIKQYSNGLLSGSLTLYYSNGKLYADETYDKDYNLKLINCSDSTGKVLAENGNGNWIKYSNDGLWQDIEEGPIKDSVENGVWYVKYNKQRNDSTVYKNGAVIATTQLGVILGKHSDMVFTAVMHEPFFPNFGNFISHNARYPAVAFENRKQGDVNVQFVVEKDGSLTGIKVLKSPDQSLTDEVVRVLKLSAPWHPGVQKDIPVRCMYSIQVNFSLVGDHEGMVKLKTAPFEKPFPLSL